MRSIEAYVLSKKYTEDTAVEFGAVIGAPAQIESIVHEDGRNVVTFLWENSYGEQRRSQMYVNDGTPIYVWQSGEQYEYGDLVIYQSCFYRCITANADTVFDATKWNEIGSPDGNYDIVNDESSLPERFTPADRKMYYSIDDGLFFLWNGYEWVAQQVVDSYLDEASNNAVSNSAVVFGIQAAIAALEYQDEPVVGSYITSVSQQDGVITVTRETLDTSPQENSQKGITSGGVFNAIKGLKSNYTVTNENLVIDYDE